MQDTRVSIIIPIYNAEEHLEECLKSLTIGSNGDANAEILCISDGSKDSSVDIVKKFADKDSRFKLIEKENEGVSMTRNRGIKEASGDYIMFLDSDDYFRPDAIKTAISQMENTQADIGIFKYDNLIEGKFEEPKMNKRIQEFKNRDNPADYIELQATVWNQIFKTSFLKKNNIFFLEGCKNTEDGAFGFCCVFNNPKYTIIDEKLYVYRRFVEGSATAKIDSIKNNQFTFEKLYSLDIYKNQPLSVQLRIVQKFLGALEYSWDRFQEESDRFILREDIKNFMTSLEKKYHILHLENIWQYPRLKSLYDENPLKKLLVR